MKRIKLWYHGSDHDIDKFQTSKLKNAQAYEAEGPGIYFASTQVVAQTYGKNLYVVTINPKRLLSKVKPAKVSEVNKFIKLVPKSILNDALTDWGDVEFEGYGKIFGEFYNNILSGENEFQVFMNLWSDLLKLDSQRFFKICKKLGIDGVRHNKGRGVEYMIIYNDKTINIK